MTIGAPETHRLVFPTEETTHPPLLTESCLEPDRRLSYTPRHDSHSTSPQRHLTVNSTKPVPVHSTLLLLKVRRLRASRRRDLAQHLERPLGGVFAGTAHVRAVVPEACVDLSTTDVDHAAPGCTSA